MDQTFAELRLDKFTKIAAAAVVGGALVLQPIAAGATAVNIGSGTGVIAINAGAAVWFVNNDITFSTTSSDWGFSNASLHTASGTRTEAFNGALSWLVGGTSAGGYHSPSGTVDITPFPVNPAVGTTLTGAPQSLSGLTVTGQMYFSPVLAVARSMLTMQNQTGAPITVTVQSASNLGSNEQTFLQTTSSGDAVLDPTDNWFVSSETANPTKASDPILTFAFSGPGGAVRGSNIDAPGSGQNALFYENYTVTIPAGQTRSLMAFVQMSDTVAHAEATAVLFNTNTSLQGTDYLTGLDATRQSQILNWNLAPRVGAVPTLGQWALIGFAWLLGLIGLSRIGVFGRRGLPAMRRSRQAGGRETPQGGPSKLPIGTGEFAAAGFAIGLMVTGLAVPGASAATVGGTCRVELRQLCPARTGADLSHCRNANRANFSASCMQSLAAANMKLKDLQPESR
jgi:hypothetical protein